MSEFTFKSPLIILFIIIACNACRSHKPVTGTETGTLFYSSCYPIESILIPKCKLDISDGNKSYQLNGSIFIRPDSICYFRGMFIVEVLRGVIYRDSFAILNQLEKICYKGSNSYLSRIVGYPVNPEMLFLLFTGDRCEDLYRDKLGFKVAARNDQILMTHKQYRNSLEVNLNPDNRNMKSIEAYALASKEPLFKTTYEQYKQYDQFMLPTALNIWASDKKNIITINTVFPDILINQNQTINFRIPKSFKIVEFR